MASPAPTKLITSNTQSGGQRTSFWILAAIPFEEPAAMYSPGKMSDPVAAKSLVIIENDAISVSVQNSKSGHTKSATATLKSTNVYYPSLVHPGDWLFIWMFDNQKSADQCVEWLEKISQGGSVGTKLCDAKSGLKHVGRITSVSTSDSVSGGVRTITQNISSSSFAELDSSVYYLWNPGEAAVPASTPSAGTGMASYADGANLNYLSAGLQQSSKNLAEAFNAFYQSTNDSTMYSPDSLVALYFILTMGIDSDNSLNSMINVRGAASDSIRVPKYVSRILGNSSASKLWELYNLTLGVQQFVVGDWKTSFAPVAQSSRSIARILPWRCKGNVPFYPAMWSNQSIWSILNEYLNPVCNEMFTSLRLNENGILQPTIYVREKPFTTGLLGAFTSDGKTDPSIQAKDPSSSKINNLVSPNREGDGMKPSVTFGNVGAGISDFTANQGSKESTFFATLPRWEVDPSVVLSFSWQTTDDRRVNFVQVQGQMAQANFVATPGPANSPESNKQTQAVVGNYVMDEADVARNGLRALIITSPFDILAGETLSGSLAPMWAKMNADWYFNGHLKAFGSITMLGVQDPICEGDNLQYGGILFHIDSVSHSCAIGGNGVKVWTTTCSLSNGMLVDSMKDTKSLPLYPAHATVGKDISLRRNNLGPGFSYDTERRQDQLRGKKT